MPRRLTSNERAEREQKRMLELLRNELRRNLERDAQQLLSGLRQQLTQELQFAFSQALAPNAGNASSNEAFSSVSGLTRIVSSILRLTARPRTTTNSYETARSHDAMSQFKLSRGQSMADMSDELGAGNRNL